MKNLFTFIFVTLCMVVTAQKNQTIEKNPLNNVSAQAAFTPLTVAPNFSVTFTDGTPANLYTTLNAGNKVMLDFFFTTCGYCQYYAPIIEQAYQAHGAGTGNVKFWGIDYNDSNAEVIAYKNQYGVTNPCASGTQGNGNAVISSYGVTSAPTYAVVCPDKVLHLGINYPPTATGFNSYFNNCANPSSVDENAEPSKTMITYMYPIPAKETVDVHVYANEYSQINIDVFDIIGNRIYNASKEINKGYYNLNIPVDNMADGTYIIKLSKNNNVTDVQKFTVMK